MAKRIMILIYIVIVLAISGFSHADEILNRAYIKEAALNTGPDDVSIISVFGYSATPCDKNPEVVPAAFDELRSSLTLEVLTTNSTFHCTDNLGPAFRISYDLRQLALVPGTIYKIHFRNSVDNNKTDLIYNPR